MPFSHKHVKKTVVSMFLTYTLSWQTKVNQLLKCWKQAVANFVSTCSMGETKSKISRPQARLATNHGFSSSQLESWVSSFKW